MLDKRQNMAPLMNTKNGARVASATIRFSSLPNWSFIVCCTQRKHMSKGNSDHTTVAVLYGIHQAAAWTELHSQTTREIPEKRTKVCNIPGSIGGCCWVRSWGCQECTWRQSGASDLAGTTGHWPMQENRSPAQHATGAGRRGSECEPCSQNARAAHLLLALLGLCI